LAQLFTVGKAGAYCR